MDSDRVILIGFAQALAAIETAWSLQEAGFRVAAFSRAGVRSPLRHVRGVTVHDVAAPEHDVRMTMRDLHALVAELAPIALLPLDDHALWVCAHGGEWGIPVAGVTGSAARYALDKQLQVIAAGQAGLPVPATRVVGDPSGAGPVDVPVIVKPARALYEVGGRLVRPTGVVAANDDELLSAQSSMWQSPLLVQPHIQGGIGEGLFGHVGASGVVGWSAHRRVRMVNPAGSASSACRSIPVDGALVEPAERFLTAVGWQGMFMLEFLRDAEGTPWFMELNGRPWGSMALARRRGFEYPAWSVHAALDPSFDPRPPTAPPDVLCRNLGLEIVHLMFVARGPRSQAQSGWPNLRTAIRSVCRRGRGDAFYNWKPSQPQVLVADTLGTVEEYARKFSASRS
jgi:hypothetical protein